MSERERMGCEETECSKSASTGSNRSVNGSFYGDAEMYRCDGGVEKGKRGVECLFARDGSSRSGSK